MPKTRRHVLTVWLPPITTVYSPQPQSRSRPFKLRCLRVELLELTPCLGLATHAFVKLRAVVTDLAEKTIGTVLVAAASAGQDLDGGVGQAAGRERANPVKQNACALVHR